MSQSNRQPTMINSQLLRFSVKSVRLLVYFGVSTFLVGLIFSWPNNFEYELKQLNDAFLMFQTFSQWLIIGCGGLFVFAIVISWISATLAEYLMAAVYCCPFLPLILTQAGRDIEDAERPFPSTLIVIGAYMLILGLSALLSIITIRILQPRTETK